MLHPTTGTRLMTTQLQQVHASESLTSQVVASLRAAITSGEMPAGAKHSVGSIAAQLGVSRTPVREAVLQLARLGFVEIRKNQGFIVVEHDNQDLVRIFQIRTWLEVPAAGIAAAKADAAAIARIRTAYENMVHAAQYTDPVTLERRDAEFHHAILALVENPRLTEIIDDLRDLLITRRHTTTERSRTMMEIAHDHEPILLAIEQHDSPAAEREMARHLDHTRDGVLALF